MVGVAGVVVGGVVVVGVVGVVVVGVVVVGVVGVVVVGVVVVGFGVVVGVVVVGVVVVGVVVVGFGVVVGVVVVGVVVVGFVVDGVVVVGFVVAAFFSPQPARPRTSPTLTRTQMAETIKTRRFIALSSPCLSLLCPWRRGVPTGHQPATSSMDCLSDYFSRERCQVVWTPHSRGQVYTNHAGKWKRSKRTGVRIRWATHALTGTRFDRPACGSRIPNAGR